MATIAFRSCGDIFFSGTTVRSRKYTVAILPPSESRMVVRWLSGGVFRFAGISSKLSTDPFAARPSVPKAGRAMPASTPPARTLIPRNFAACWTGERPPPERLFGMRAAYVLVCRTEVNALA